MSESLAWDEIAGLLGRALGEPVSGGVPLTPGWSSRTTWAAHGERTGPLVVKARHGDDADRKTAWCAGRLPLLGARGYPVPTIVWHGPRPVASDRPEPATRPSAHGARRAAVRRTAARRGARAGRAAGQRRDPG